MFKAKQIVIPPEPISPSEAKKLLSHAKNSLMWYTDSAYTKHELKEKLYKKGYPKHAVKIKTKDGVRSIDFVKQALKYCESLYRLQDETEMAIDFAESFSDRGKSSRDLKFKLYSKGFKKTDVEASLKEYDVENAIKNALDSIKRKSTIKNKEPFERKKKIIQNLMQKGFQYGDISRYMDKIEEV